MSSSSSIKKKKNNGQRLVVTIENNEEELCKIYYHWSAYSRSALMETRDIVNALFDEYNEIEDIRLRMIRFVESNGGGIKGEKDSDEWKYIQNTYPNEIFKEEGISRNYGLIAISEDGMNDLQDWREGDIIINIDTHRVINFVNWCCDSIDIYNEYHRKLNNRWKDIVLEDIPELDCDLYDFHYKDIDYLIEALDNSPDYIVRYGNTIYGIIA